MCYVCTSSLGIGTVTLEVTNHMPPRSGLLCQGVSIPRGNRKGWTVGMGNLQGLDGDGCEDGEVSCVDAWVDGAVI